MNWRLIEDGAYSGAWNMARDEALMLCQDASTPPVLRFYSWEPATLSIGRLQKYASLSAHRASQPLVRRPTGGRAVWHQHEITYCAVIHEQYLPRAARSVIGAYHWLSAGFIAGLETLGVRAELSPAHCKAATHNATAATNCFNAAAQCDFLVDGRKLIGAAQCRKDGVILQHGAILLDVDASAWQNALGSEMESAISLHALGVVATREEIVTALCKGMVSTWDIAFGHSVFSASEMHVAARLHNGKYSTFAWNERGQAAEH
jgi:lipoate-protein ligase A